MVPDTFKHGAEVVVTGRVRDDGTFDASELLAKCPSKYEAAEPAAPGAQHPDTIPLTVGA